MMYLALAGKSFLVTIVFATLAFGQSYQQWLALASVLLAALAELLRTRSDRDFLRMHRDQLAETLAWVQRKRGRA